MGNRAGRNRAITGPGAYGGEYDPGYGLDYYGGSYDPALGGKKNLSLVIFRSTDLM